MLRRHARRKSLVSYKSNDFRKALGEQAVAERAGKPGISRLYGTGLLLASLVSQTEDVSRTDLFS
jgi:hypothetical protein